MTKPAEVAARVSERRARGIVHELLRQRAAPGDAEDVDIADASASSSRAASRDSQVNR